MEAEIAIYEKAIIEARKTLSSTETASANQILLKAQKDVDAVRLMRQIAQEEIKKTFGDT